MPVIKDCFHCKKAFSLSPSKAHRQFCSPNCANLSRMQNTLKDCLFCGQEFKSVSTKYGYSKFCSKKCGGLFKENKINKSCENCSVSFSVPQNQISAKYCSSKCYGEAKTNMLSVCCESCGKTYTLTKRRAENSKFCSRECYFRSVENVIVLRCLVCKNEYTAQSEKSRFCSLKCNGIYRDRKITISCLNCSTEVRKSPSSAKGSKYCSPKCSNQHRAGIIETEKGIYKSCATCKMLKPLSAFDLSTKAKFGIKGTCRKCDGEMEFRNKGIQLPSKPLLQIMYLVENRSQRQLGEIFGVSSHTISKLIKHYGIKPRPTQWGQKFHTNCGHTVRSTYEVAVCNWLHENKISHDYEPPLGVKNYRADYFANGYYIEVWGVSGNDEYNKRKNIKRQIYVENNHKLLQIYSTDFAVENQNRWSRKLEKHFIKNNSEAQI
jgi:hypothetical protein